MDFNSFIKESLLATAEIANQNFGKVVGTTKSEDNNQVLTSTDLEIGKLLVGKIQEAFPDHNIIDEEAGVIDKKGEFTWVIDPIDGTSNFANGLPTYGVMLGLLKGSVAIAGGIALPAFKEIYVAEKGKGAFSNGTRVKVTDELDLLHVLVAYGIDGHQENPELTRNEAKLLAEIVLNIRNLRSSNSVFDAAMVAKGKYGGFINRTSKIWDNVAQQIVIEEAGGIYTDLLGNSIDYSNPLEKATQNFTFCAAAPQLHSQLQKIIHVIV